jgi:hypothetical protein
MRRAFLTILRVVLLVLLVAVLAIGLWLVRPVQTGAGDMSRFQAGTVYLQLAREQPGYCQQGYVVGIVGAMVSSPAIAVDKATDLPWIITPPEDEGEIRWSDVPGEAWRLLGRSLDRLFHDPRHRCALPRPSEWTSEMMEQ